MSTIPDLAVQAARSIDHLAAHLVAICSTNEEAATIAAYAAEAKGAVFAMCPAGSVPNSYGDDPGADDPDVETPEPASTPDELPGSEDDDDAEEYVPMDPSVAPDVPGQPETQTEPVGDFVVPHGPPLLV